MSPNRRSCRGGGPGGGPVLADGTHGINEVAAQGPTVSALAAVALGALVGAAWVRRWRHSADPPAAPPPAASPPALPGLTPPTSPTAWLSLSSADAERL